MALTDSLDELITNGSITPQLAMKVLQQVHINETAVFALPNTHLLWLHMASLTNRWRTPSLDK